MAGRGRDGGAGDGVTDWPARLAAGGSIAERVVVVVAHPDDETLFAGSLLARLDDGVVIVLTDGAPADMDDARRLGFATRAAYATARAGELDQALDRLGFRGACRRYDVTDKEAVCHLDTLAARLRDDLAGAALVLTHGYEGGHPDHDAAACAVARAVAMLDAPPAHGEFASYCHIDGERRFGRFWPDRAHPEHRRPLAPADTARVAGALAAHATQAECFGSWRPTHEVWRTAPAYDFAAPPPPAVTLYDSFGWAISSTRWRALATASLPAPPRRSAGPAASAATQSGR